MTNFFVYGRAVALPVSGKQAGVRRDPHKKKYVRGARIEKQEFRNTRRVLYLGRKIGIGFNNNKK